MTRLEQIKKSWPCGMVGMTIAEYLNARYLDRVGFCRFFPGHKLLSFDDYFKEEIK